MIKNCNVSHTGEKQTLKQTETTQCSQTAGVSTCISNSSNVHYTACMCLLTMGLVHCGFVCEISRKLSWNFPKQTCCTNPSVPFPAEEDQKLTKPDINYITSQTIKGWNIKVKHSNCGFFFRQKANKQRQIKYIKLCLAYTNIKIATKNRYNLTDWEW